MFYWTVVKKSLLHNSRHEFRASEACRDLVDTLKTDDDASLVGPDSELIQRISAIFDVPEDYLDVNTAPALFSPNAMPDDEYSGGTYNLSFKNCLMRCADHARTAGLRAGYMDPLSQIIDDLFLKVVARNLTVLRRWGIPEKEAINNCIADVYTSQIIRYHPSVIEARCIIVRSSGTL